MEKFKDIYAEAIKNAKKLISNHNRKMEAEEVVSEAYLMCNGDVTIESMKKNVLLFLQRSSHDRLKEIKSTHINPHLMEQQCTRCREVLPIAFFRMIHDRILHCSFHLNMCKKCRYIYDNVLQKAKEYYHKHKDEEAFKIKRKHQKEEDRRKNRKRILEYERAYRFKNRNKLNANARNYMKNNEKAKSDARRRQREFQKRKKAQLYI